jgi:hypothetical protein
VVGAAALLRGWLLLLRRVPAESRLASFDAAPAHGGPPGVFAVVTGRGRHAAGGVSRLRPAIRQLLVSGELGAAAEIIEPAGNAGVIYIREEAMAALLAAPRLNLSLGPASEEEALCQALTTAAATAADYAAVAPTKSE